MDPKGVNDAISGPPLHTTSSLFHTCSFVEPRGDTDCMAKVMGIVNVTPDSFSDGGLFLDPERAISHGLELTAEGADILDVGGESTRPGARAVSAATERERTRPVVEALAAAGGPPVSIDTSKAEVARAALDSGAAIVNDVTALRADPELGDLCAERDCGLVLMHMLGTPRTMQRDPTYGDVVDEVRAFLAERIEVAVAAGVAEQRIWVDPGIGFGKTVEHNLALLRRLGELCELGRPIVVGTSRKSFLGAITGREVDRRLGGSVASNVIALAAGAEVFRVHDVLAARQALDVAETILGRRAWRREGVARA
jgi:dihydropteroate synthase